MSVIDGGILADSRDVLVDLVAQLDNLAIPSHIPLDSFGWAEHRPTTAGWWSTSAPS